MSIIPDHPGAFVVYRLPDKGSNPGDRWRLRRPDGSVAAFSDMNAAWRVARIGAQVAKTRAIKYGSRGFILKEEDYRGSTTR
jgi:hypothetical protein